MGLGIFLTQITCPPQASHAPASAPHSAVTSFFSIPLSSVAVVFSMKLSMMALVVLGTLIITIFNQDTKKEIYIE